MHNPPYPARALARLSLAIVVGWVMGACADAPSRDPTAPDVGAGAIDAQSLSVLATRNNWQGRHSGERPARFHMVAAHIDNVIYLIGGDTGLDPDRALVNVDAYNVATNSWSPRQQLPGGRSDMHGASVIAGKLYVAGGFRPFGTGYTLSKVLFVYNPGTNLWGKGADMPVSGARGVQGVIAGRLYVYVGSFSSDADFFRYNPTSNRWVKLASPPTQHVGGEGGVINGKFYLVGGEGGAGLLAHPTLNVYDPATKSWTTKAPMRTARRDAFAGVINGKLYVGGGLTDAGEKVSSLEAYDPATNRWTWRASMPTAWSHGAAAVAGGRLFAIGGEDSEGLTTKVAAYTP
jgi:N-acetylneuraminic acid mutarotase